MTYTEFRTLPCCGHQLPWDPKWFEGLNAVVGGTLSEAGILKELAKKHACKKKKVRQ